MALEVYVAQPETHFELMRLMSILSKTLSPEIKAEFEKLGKSPFESFKRVFSTPPDKISNVSLLFGRTFEEISQKVAQYSKTPPAPEAFRQVINHSLQGAIWAGVFSGVVDTVLTFSNSLLVKAYNLFSGKKTDGFYRQEAWVEDIVGNKMIKKLRLLYPSNISSDEMTALHNGARLVSKSGFFGKLLRSILGSTLNSAWIKTIVNTLSKTPDKELFSHVSSLDTQHQTFHTFIESARQVSQNSFFTERLSGYAQWCFNFVPTQYVEILNKIIEPFFKRIDNIIEPAQSLFLSIPFFGKMVEIFSTNIPLKSELLTGTVSLAYNMITGMGNMALLDESKHNEDKIFPQALTVLNNSNHWKVMQAYIEAVYRRIDSQVLKHEGAILC